MDGRKSRIVIKEDNGLGMVTVIVLFLMLILIPLIFWWVGAKHVDETVPDFATGYVVEVSDGDVTE